MVIKKVSSNEYEELRIIIKNLCGLELGQKKQYLVESRFAPIMKKLALENFSELIQLLKYRDYNQKYAQILVDAITTHETSFFRDSSPFDTLKEVLKKNKKNHLRIWSAAASTGQEAYSIAMTIEDHNKRSYKQSITYEILGTDISENVLEYARTGTYKQYEISRGINIEYLRKYFITKDMTYTVIAALKQSIIFKPFNLVSSHYSLGRFDIIFCRNVLIYFNDETKKLIYKNLHRSLSQDGYLFIGSAESTLNYSNDFKKERVGQSFLYRP